MQELVFVVAIGVVYFHLQLGNEEVRVKCHGNRRSTLPIYRYQQFNRKRNAENMI